MGWDLVIIGGGPVGLATAIAARCRGLSAVVVERDPGLPDKACGEGLMPGAVAALEALGVSLHGSVELRGIRFIDGAARADGEFPALRGRALSRRQLMLALLERASALGVARLAGHTLRDFAWDGGAVRASVVPAGGGSKLVLEGRLLVGADGLRSGVRRRAGLELPSGERLRFGARRHYHCAPWTDWVEVYWDAGVEAYVTPLGTSQVGVALLSDGRPGSFEAELARFPTLASRLGAAADRVRGAGPFEQRVSSVLAPGVALVGDAAGYLDAISGEGLALGLRSARMLVERFSAGELWRYPKDHARITASYVLMTRVLLAIGRRPRLRRWLISELGRRPGLFCDLVGIAADTRAPARSLFGGALRPLGPLLSGLALDP